MDKEIVTITKSGLLSDLEKGLKRDQMAAKYNVSRNVINKVVKMAGLSGRRAIKEMFKFVNDCDSPRSTETTGTIINEEVI